MRGREAHAFDVVVDFGVFFDEEPGCGDIGFGLVIVVIADKVFDSVLREERLELCEELPRERLVWGDDERGSLDALDDGCDREGFSAASDAEQCLCASAFIESLDEAVDRLWLVAAWRKL